MPLLHDALSGHELRARAEVLESHARIEETADAPERLDVLQERAEPGLELFPGHALSQPVASW
jgi:hypothetical protein